MAKARRKLIKAVKKEQAELQAAAAKRKSGASLWGTIGGLLLGGLTGGLASPLIAGLASGAGTYIGGKLGAEWSGVSKKDILKGRFFQGERESISKSIEDSIGASALKSGLTAGLMQFGGSVLKMGKGGGIQVASSPAGGLGKAAKGVAKAGGGVSDTLSKIWKSGDKAKLTERYGSGWSLGKAMDIKGSFLGKGFEKLKSSIASNQLKTAEIGASKRLSKAISPTTGDTMLHDLTKSRDKLFQQNVGLGSGTKGVNLPYKSSYVTDSSAGMTLADMRGRAIPISEGGSRALMGGGTAPRPIKGTNWSEYAKTGDIQRGQELQARARRGTEALTEMKGRLKGRGGLPTAGMDQLREEIRMLPGDMLKPTAPKLTTGQQTAYERMRQMQADEGVDFHSFTGDKGKQYAGFDSPEYGGKGYIDWQTGEKTMIGPAPDRPSVPVDPGYTDWDVGSGEVEPYSEAKTAWQFQGTPDEIAARMQRNPGFKAGVEKYYSDFAKSLEPELDLAKFGDWDTPPPIPEELSTGRVGTGFTPEEEAFYTQPIPKQETFPIKPNTARPQLGQFSDRRSWQDRLFGGRR